ncbi:PREDICTED: ATP synthase subunit d, mitochondrial [Gavialis gangeticus]|uniref:ATP synthase subunit d, mitochondrial n=1 Tax=Gavialis gangeticus TaxID=94835 RepID=UPI00092F6853|nr:PREDICTED: ATP synthase subunit d, mitochondrial [Gavialis gangeticus]
MAGRRVAQKAIDWVAFAEHVSPDNRIKFNALKTISDTISSRLTSLPEKPPAIDWAYYKKTIALAGLVDEFEKKFSALKIPMPVDTETAKIDAQEKATEKDAIAYVDASKARVVEYEKELERYRNMIPFELMTWEELNEAFRETKLDKEKHQYWPHKPITDM